MALITPLILIGWGILQIHPPSAYIAVGVLLWIELTLYGILLRPDNKP